MDGWLCGWRGICWEVIVDLSFCMLAERGQVRKAGNGCRCPSKGRACVGVGRRLRYKKCRLRVDAGRSILVRDGLCGF